MDEEEEYYHVIAGDPEEGEAGELPDGDETSGEEVEREASDDLPTDDAEAVAQTSYIEEYIADYSPESLAAYEESGAVAVAVYDDETEAVVPWSQVSDPGSAPPADDVATANRQHFWHTPDSAPAGAAGAYVTDCEREEWEAEYAEEGHGGLSAPTAQRPWLNMLINSLGALWRTGLNNLVSITRGAVAFYDGAGNGESNVTASFGPAGAQVGKSDGKHVVLDSDGLTAYGPDGSLAPVRASNISLLEAEAAKVRDLTADQLSAAVAYITLLTADSITAESLSADIAKVHELTAESLSAAAGYVGALQAGSVDAQAVIADHGDFEAVKANAMKVADLTAAQLASDHAKVGRLDADYARADFANVSAADVAVAKVRDLLSRTGWFESVDVADGTFTGRLTATVIDGSALNVTNIRADSLVLLGDDGLYYALNVAGMGEAVAAALPAEVQEEMRSGLHGGNIIAGTITADKVTVTDLHAFGAMIAGTEVEAGSLHTAGKQALDSPAPGFFLDSGGHLAVGDRDSYLAVYQDASGAWKVRVSADEVTIGGRTPITALDISTERTATGYDVTIGDETFSLVNGADGAKGDPGTGAAVSKSGSTVTVTDGSGNSVTVSDGATFTPSVDASGNLSWTNDGGRANPATRNIKGDPGDDSSLKYISTFSDGILVHPEGDEATGWRIRDAVELLKSGASYIWAGASNAAALVRVGLASAGNVVMSGEGYVDVRHGSDVTAHFGYDGAGGWPHYTLGHRQGGSEAGNRSLGQGYNVVASGEFSHAQGWKTKASGGSSHAEGYSETADFAEAAGRASHVEGLNSRNTNRVLKAVGDASHAEGCDTQAVGDYSHAEGYYTYAYGEGSHAEGRGTSAGKHGHAEGRGCSAGECAHAQGLGTVASSPCQTALGRYNAEDADGEFAVIVGNGAELSPKNISTLDWEGDAWLAGALTAAGAALSGDLEAAGARLGGALEAASAGLSGSLRAAAAVLGEFAGENDDYALTVGNGVEDAPSNSAFIKRSGFAWFAESINFSGTGRLHRSGEYFYFTAYGDDAQTVPLWQVRMAHLSGAAPLATRVYGNGAWGPWTDLSLDLRASRTAGAVFAAPSTANGTPSFRRLVPHDLPSYSFGTLARAGSGAAAGFNYNATSNITSASSSSLASGAWNHYNTFKVAEAGIYLVYVKARFPSAASGVHSIAISTSTDDPSTNALSHVTYPGTATRISYAFVMDVGSDNTQYYVHIYQSSGSAATMGQVAVRGMKIGRT